MIPNLNEYNAEYCGENNQLVFKKIGEVVGKRKKHRRTKKRYNNISIQKIQTPKSFAIDGGLCGEIIQEYRQHKKIPPVLLDDENILIGGYEIYAACLDLAITKVPFIVKHLTKCQLRHSVSRNPVANKQYKLIDCDGKVFYVSEKAKKKFNEVYRLCCQLGYIVKITAEREYTITDASGRKIFENEKNRGRITKELRDRVIANIE